MPVRREERSAGSAGGGLAGRVQSGDAAALEQNAEVEFERNRERYEFLKWGKNAFHNFRVAPPATGIVHQVNLEYLAQVAMTRTADGKTWVFPDTVVGTDSHTPMVNGLGVLGWGVGGIEAEAAMLAMTKLARFAIDSAMNWWPSKFFP